MLGLVKSSGEMKVFLGIVLVAIVLVGVTLLATRGGEGGVNPPPVPPPDFRKDATMRPLLMPKGTPILGRADAPYTLVEFGDYMCASCRASEPGVEKMLKQYADKMNYVFHHVKISRAHYHSPTLAQAVAAAQVQGKFWEMHKKVFSSQQTWEAMDPDDVKKTLKEIAGGLGLDMMRFTAYFQGAQAVKDTTAQDKLAADAHVTSTPTFILLKPNDKIAVLQSFTQADELLKKPDTWK